MSSFHLTLSSHVLSKFICTKAHEIVITDIIAFDVGRTLPNTDLSRDFMGLVVDGSMDLGMLIWHPLQIFLQGRMTSQRESLGHQTHSLIYDYY